MKYVVGRSILAGCSSYDVGEVSEQSSEVTEWGSVSLSLRGPGRDVPQNQNKNFITGRTGCTKI